MKKPSRTFICQSCGEQFPRWAGKCDSCGSWNTIVEENSGGKFDKPVLKQSSAQPYGRYAKPVPISSISGEDYKRISSGFSELDIVLGGGIVPGSIVLIGGEPGVGKSTLIL